MISAVTAWLSCSVSEHCGWNSQCRNGVCECTEGFVSSENEHDCVNRKFNLYFYLKLINIIEISK